MAEDKRNDSTQQLIAEGEALRSKGEGKKPPGTRTLVRESEALIGRKPSAGLPPGVKSLLIAALGLALFAIAVSLVFLLWA